MLLTFEQTYNPIMLTQPTHTHIYVYIYNSPFILLWWTYIFGTLKLELLRGLLRNQQQYGNIQQGPKDLEARLGIRAYSKVNIKYYNPWPHFNNKHLKQTPSILLKYLLKKERKKERRRKKNVASGPWRLSFLSFIADPPLLLITILVLHWHFNNVCFLTLIM